MRTTSITLAVLFASGALVLAGCGNLVEDAVQGAVDNGVEKAVEGAVGEGADIEFDSDGTAAVPESFPEGFPLPPGDPRFAMAVGNTWSLDYTIPDESVATDLNAWYESAGFELVGEQDLGTLKMWIWQNDEHSATVNVLEDSGVLSLTYSLTVRE